MHPRSEVSDDDDASWNSSPLFPTDSITRVPDMVPPDAARSGNPVAPPFVHRYNIRRGADFHIGCFVPQASTSDYTLEFYKDGQVIGDRDLPDTVLTPADPPAGQNQVSLNFSNFQPEHNGVYYCNATLNSGSLSFILDEATDLFLYGTGKLCMRTKCVYIAIGRCQLVISIAFPSSVVQVKNRLLNNFVISFLCSTAEPSVIQSHTTGAVFLSEEEDLVLDADFRGDYVQSDWVYSADDPTFTSFERLSTFESSGVTFSNLNQRYTVANQTAAHRFGYYAPAIEAKLRDVPSVDLNFVVHVLSDDDGEWMPCVTQCKYSCKYKCRLIA